MKVYEQPKPRKGTDVEDTVSSTKGSEDMDPPKGPGGSGEGGTGIGSSSGADNIADGARLREYYRQAERYGTGSIKELENGRYRFYEELKSAQTQGEMAGARHVREWNPYTGLKRDWYETFDHAGNIRQVRPSKVHYMFDIDGNYIGCWSP